MEETGIISLSSFNELIFVAETCSLFFEAGAELLNII
jgi:hypothetical protein